MKTLLSTISRSFALGTAAGLAALSSAALAGDWPQWRGPHFNGSTDEKGLPSTWTKESALWSADMTGPSAATPVVLGDHVYVSSVDSANSSLHALCFDRKTGKKLWDKTVGEGTIQRDEKSNFASSSPVASTEAVFFLYSSGAIAAFDPNGKELWTRNITKDYGDFAFQWTYSSSPMLSGGKLYIEVLQRDVPVHGHGRTDGPIDSYLLALDPTSGKPLWKITRPSEAAAESHEAYSTPIPFEYHGRKEILITGGDCITGHDPETGKELWRWGTWNPTKIGHWRLVPSPVAGGDVVLACGPKGSPIYAIKAGGSGTLPDSAIAWNTSQNKALSTDVPTPLFYNGDFFILGDGRRSLSRVDPATGNPKWTAEIPGRRKIESSPSAGDGKIYIMNFAGEVSVVDANDGKVLNTILMGEDGDDMIRAAISIAGGDLFIRTNHKLFCVGK